MKMNTFYAFNNYRRYFVLIIDMEKKKVIVNYKVDTQKRSIIMVFLFIIAIEVNQKLF